VYWNHNRLLFDTNSIKGTELQSPQRTESVAFMARGMTDRGGYQKSSYKNRLSISFHPHLSVFISSVRHLAQMLALISADQTSKDEVD
jgi:hypothetical protein